VPDALERVGVRVLEDTAAKLNTPAGPLWVAGVSDLSGSDDAHSGKALTLTVERP